MHRFCTDEDTILLDIRSALHYIAVMEAQITLRVDVEDRDSIQRIADQHQWTFSQAARVLLREAIEQRNGGKDDGKRD